MHGRGLAYLDKCTGKNWLILVNARERIPVLHTKNPKFRTSGFAPYKMAAMVRYEIGKWLSTVLEHGGVPEKSKYVAVIWIRNLVLEIHHSNCTLKNI